MAYIVICREWYDDNCHTVGVTAAEIDSITDDQLMEVSNVLLDMDSKLVTTMTLLICMKVSWWLTNHHVGQNEWVGYPRKCAQSLIPDVLNSPVAMGWLWAGGHWLSTRRSLKSLNIEVGANVRALAYFPTVSEDVLKRIGSRPAGTAKIFDCLAAFRGVAVSCYRSEVHFPIELAFLEEQSRLITFYRSKTGVVPSPCAISISAPGSPSHAIALFT